MDRWQRGQPQDKTITTQRRAVHCSNRRANEKRIWRRWKSRFYLYRSYRQVAPYRGYPGPDIWKQWLAVPKYITDCESGGDWYAVNPSGAAYLYQLLDKGAPYPSTPQAKVANHRIAAEVWNGGAGASNWACA